MAWLLLALAVLTPWWRIPQDNADGAGMLAHLHGFFVGMDLLYDDEYAALRMSPLFAFVTRPEGGGGVVSNHWPAGATWLQAPGYLLGLVAYRILRWVGSVGEGAIWVVPLLGVRTWALALLWAWARGVKRWIGEVLGPGAGAAVAAIGVVGTPLLYYAAEAPLRPHLYGALVVTVLVWLWSRPLAEDAEPGPRLQRAAALGALAGLAATIRPQLAPLLLLALHDLWPGREGRGRRLLAAVASAAVWPLTGLRLQLWMYGSGVSGYAIGETTHHLGHLLVSPYHGVMTWSPVVALGVAGLVVGGVGRERGAWLLLALFALQLWVNSGQRPIEPFQVLGTRTWGGGTAFGPRKLVDSLPLLLPGAIWLVRELRQRLGGKRTAWVLGGLAVLCCLPTLLLHLAAFVEPSTTAEVMDWRRLAAALPVGLDLEAWPRALGQRALPSGVVLTLGAVVGGPCVAVLGLLRHRTAGVARQGGGLAESGSGAGLGAPIAATAVGLGVVANLWLALLITRSDQILHDEPQRMGVAAMRLDPAHEYWVPLINAAARAQQAERLGEGAVGPP